MINTEQQPRFLTLLQSFLDDLPVVMQVYQPEGLMVATNRMSEQFWKVPREVGVGQFNMLTDPQNVTLGVPAIFARVLQGETVTLPPVPYDTGQVGLNVPAGVQVWVDVTYIPIRDASGSIAYVGVIHRDVTAEVEQARGLQTDSNLVAEQLTAIELARQEMVAQQEEITHQREMIRSLASPVIQVWAGILTVPLVGLIDTQRAAAITEDLLEAIVHYQAESVILDITGVTTVDTQVANYLLSAARACRLLGSMVAVVGISNEVAQTMVHLGLDVSEIVTRANLQAGIAWAFERQNLVVSKRVSG